MSAASPVILRFANLRKAFGGQTVLNEVSGQIRRGEVILLRGENGSGKTTLLNILTGCLEPDSGSIEIFGPESDNHEFSFPRPWYSDLNPFQRFTPERVARLGVGRTWQDVRLFGSLDLADNIAAAEPDESDSPWAALFNPGRTTHTNRLRRECAANTLADLGLSDRETSSADHISLGQSKRVAIARALHARVRILFLDEPLAGLDADGIRDVLTHLRTLATEHGLTLVIIEHVLNIPRLLDFVTSVWTLKNGQMTITNPAAIQQELATNATPTDIHAIIRQALQREVPITTEALPQGAKLTTYWLAFPQPSQDAPPVLEVTNLTLQRGPRRLFDDATDVRSTGLTLRIQSGTLNVLEAPNGWGKTSLLNRIIGFLPQASGTVRLNGTTLPDTAAIPAFHKAGGRALLSELTLFPTLTVAETTTLARVAPKEDDHHRYAGSLSGGESRKLGIECLGISAVSLMDEFFQGLDSASSTTALSSLFSQSSERTLLFFQPSAPATS